MGFPLPYKSCTLYNEYLVDDGKTKMSHIVLAEVIRVSQEDTHIYTTDKFINCTS